MRKTKAEVSVDVPEEMVTDLIRAEMVKALGSKDQLVEAVVKAAMTAKKNSYDRDSLFATGVNLAIRQAATETFQAWLQKKKKVIEKAIQRRLSGEGDEFVEKIAKQIVEGLATSFSVRATLTIED